MNTPHTLQAQLEAALAKNKDLEQDLHAERVGRLLAERRATIAAQGVGERYARNLPDPWASSKEKP